MARAFGAAGFGWRRAAPGVSPGLTTGLAATKPGPQAKDCDYSTFRANDASPAELLGTGALRDLGHFPGLGLGNGAAFLDHHAVAHLRVVALVVGVVLLGALHHLADGRMHHLALDHHGDRLVHLVAHHHAGELALVLGFGGAVRGLAHFAPPFDFSLMKVCTRAIWRRRRSISLCLVRLCVASCMRRPNWAWLR